MGSPLHLGGNRSQVHIKHLVPGTEEVLRNRDFISSLVSGLCDVGPALKWRWLHSTSLVTDGAIGYQL